MDGDLERNKRMNMWDFLDLQAYRLSEARYQEILSKE